MTAVCPVCRTLGACPHGPSGGPYMSLEFAGREITPPRRIACDDPGIIYMTTEPRRASFTARTEATRDDWQTPLRIVQALGSFDLDPCANCRAPTRLATRGFTVAENGLEQPWQGRVWLNPPYGAEARLWIARLAAHGNGIALIPPRLGAKWFHEQVLDTFDGILFHKGRIAFLDPDTGLPVKGNNADSVFVAYGNENTAALAASGLPGKLWRAR